jgi:hypothetical protein
MQPLMDSLPTPCSTLESSLPLILGYVLPPVGALLSAIALWVASRARTTSAAAQSTSRAAVAISLQPREPHERSARDTDAPDRRKS